MKRAALAEAIKADLLAERPAAAATQECFTCGRPFLKPGERFCAERCREAFDAGMGPYDPNYAGKSQQRWYALPLGPRGLMLTCKGCGRTFDSVGLRCCSVECERKHRLKLEVADHPFRIEKRKCEECGGDIPNWRNGRRVSKATRFCSPRCQRRNPGKPSGSPNPGFDVQTVKKWAKNGGSR